MALYLDVEGFDDGFSEDEAAATTTSSAGSAATPATTAVALRQQKQYWPAAHTEALLALIHEHREELRTCRIQKQVWSRIAQRLNERFYPGCGGGGRLTAEHCSTKWRNLKRDLRLVEGGANSGAGHSGARNLEVLATVAHLEVMLGRADAADAAAASRRHSLVDFEGLALSSSTASAAAVPPATRCHHQAEPFDMSISAMVSTPPPPPQLTPATTPSTATMSMPPVAFRQRSGSVSSTAGTLRRYQSMPPFGGGQTPTPPPPPPPPLEDQRAQALLASLLARGPQLPPQLELCEARRTIEHLRQSELHSISASSSRLNQLDHLASVIDSALAAGGGGGKGGASGGANGGRPNPM